MQIFATTSSLTTEAALRFALTLATLYAAHSVADHWVQTHGQACGKAAPGRAGWTANLAHVTTYTATLALAWPWSDGGSASATRPVGSWPASPSKTPGSPGSNAPLGAGRA
ncbi:hypothetical protein [Microtetraspora malaysiensis]|uniref:hypothetical protein n=1 Tax=Microtetraspora malaysiensis TaxID=161358 RepID=UPI0008315534|nr:hypothetical protein [Microtetraspora malaysiensis]